MVDYSRFAHIDDSSSDDDDVAMEHVKHVAREVLGRPGGPQQNIDEMLESFRAGEARRRPEDHPLLPPPRFDVGARVMCCVEEDEEMWLTGTVIRHWAQQEGMVCPYVVQVDEDRGEIWVHEDSESAIRALETCQIVKRRPPASLAKALLEGLIVSFEERDVFINHECAARNSGAIRGQFGCSSGAVLAQFF